MKTEIKIVGTLSEVRKHLEFDSDDELLYRFCEDEMLSEDAVIELVSTKNEAFIVWDNNGVKTKNWLRCWQVQKNNCVKI